MHVLTVAINERKIGPSRGVHPPLSTYRLRNTTAHDLEYTHFRLDGEIGKYLVVTVAAACCIVLTVDINAWSVHAIKGLACPCALGNTNTTHDLKCNHVRPGEKIGEYLAVTVVAA